MKTAKKPRKLPKAQFSKKPENPRSRRLRLAWSDRKLGDDGRIVYLGNVQLYVLRNNLRNNPERLTTARWATPGAYRVTWYIGCEEVSRNEVPGLTSVNFKSLGEGQRAVERWLRPFLKIAVSLINVETQVSLNSGAFRR